MLTLQDQVNSLTSTNETLTKEKDQIVNKCKEYLSEMTNREGSLKSEVLDF